MACCFLEMDNGTMNRKQIRAKYARYAAWSESAPGRQYLIDLYRRHGAGQPRPTFRLLVVARSRTGEDDQGRLDELKTLAAKLPAALRNRLWFATVAEFRQWQRDPAPLEAAIWHSGRELARQDKLPGPARGDRCKPATLDSGSGTARFHSLFPPAETAPPHGTLEPKPTGDCPGL
jgi:hypothetical protein